MKYEVTIIREVHEEYEIEAPDIETAKLRLESGNEGTLIEQVGGDILSCRVRQIKDV